MSGQVRCIMVDTRPIAGQDTDPSSGPCIRRAEVQGIGLSFFAIGSCDLRVVTNPFRIKPRPGFGVCQRLGSCGLRYGDLSSFQPFFDVFLI